MAIDYGQARIGIAATDELGIMAHPVETIPSNAAHGIDALDRIVELVAARRIRTLVLGLPLRLDGSEGHAAERVRCFAEKLHACLPELPIVWVDESFSTTDAAAKLREVGRNARRQKMVIDQAAAVEILNRWMGY
ncbi:MAG: Holliday junction resolvase RuvX [Luteolibacter sp.]